MSTDSGQTDAQEPTTARDGGFEFGVPETDHTIEIEYSVVHTDTIELSRGGDTERYADTDGCYLPDSQEISCTCGETFTSEDDAREHLQQTQGPTPPLNIPTEFAGPEWTGKTNEIHSGFVRGEQNASNILLKVETGQQYLAATSRETFQPPANFAFEDWQPLSGGRLTHQNGNPQFKEYVLQRALWGAGASPGYEPSRFTIFYRGMKPLYVEGPEGGVAVAPAVTKRTEVKTD